MPTSTARYAAENKEHLLLTDGHQAACALMRKGDVKGCITLLDDLIAHRAQNETLRLVRAEAHLTSGGWVKAHADYSVYIKLCDRTRSAQLANAYYGCAVCSAKQHDPLRALHELDLCLASAPHLQEQLCEEGASAAPKAAIARFVLLSSSTSLRQRYARTRRRTRRDTQAAARLPAAAALSEARAAASFVGDKLWWVPVRQLEDALAEAHARGRTPLLLDASPLRPVDCFFSYGSCTIIHAKQLVLDIRLGGVPVAEAREALRKELVHALRWGHALVIEMVDSAADFLNAYCSDDAFPLRLFDHAALPAGTELKRTPWETILRPADLHQGRFFVPLNFRVAVTSTLAPGKFERLLADSLPLQHLQPVLVLPSAGAAGSGDSAGAADEISSPTTVVNGFAGMD